MAALDMTAFDAMFKEIYPDGVPEEVAYRKHVFLELVPKADDFEGDVLVLPLFYGGPAGRSATLSTAITNESPSKSKKFVLTIGQDYCSWSVDARTIYASRSNRGAFVSARKKEADLALQSLGLSIAHALYDDGNASIAVVGSGTASPITLTNARDTRWFQEGMVIIADDTADGSSPRVGSGTVTTINEDTGVVAYTGTITALAVGDFIFAQGDVGGLKAKGLAAWLPLAAPSATLFFGVDRTVAPVKLAGTRIDTPTSGIRENVSTLLELVSERGGMPDRVFMSPTNFNALAKDTEATVLREQGGTAKFGFKAFEFEFSGGTAMVTADPDCPGNRAYALTMSSWMVHHLEPLPHIVRDDGRDGVRGATTDTIQMRARTWFQLGCEAPAWNGVCSL